MNTSVQLFLKCPSFVETEFSETGRWRRGPCFVACAFPCKRDLVKQDKNMANILIRFSNAFEKNWSFNQGHGSSGVGGKVQMLNAMS